MSAINDDDARSLIGAYVLDAVNADERVAVEALIARDADAAAEARRLTVAVDSIVHVTVDDLVARDEPGPSAMVWNNIAAGMANSPQVIDELAQRRSKRTAPRWIAAVAAAGLLMVGGTLAWRASTRTSSISEQASAALQESTSSRGTLTNDVISARAVVTDDGDGYLLIDQLDTPPAGTTYQLWSLDGPQPMSLGVIGTKPKAVSFAAASQPRSLAISIEPEGGSAQPTNPIGALTLS
jgi:anti-sigma-K factor RskA